MDIKQKLKLAQIKNHKNVLTDENNISLNSVLCSEKFQKIISGCRDFRERIYTPIKTVLIFIKQVLNPDKSCKNAIAELAAEQLIKEGNIISINTSSYCDARKRLPESAVKDLVKESGKTSLKQTMPTWKAFGRNLKGVDGSTFLMSDTIENQELYPQQKGQKKGIGFPIVRVA